jgi:hypothetical protein
MRSWLKNLLNPHAKSEATLLENLRNIYGCYQNLLSAREKALALLNGPLENTTRDLSTHIGTVIDALNMISHQCSLDLKTRFQEIKTALTDPQGNPEWLPTSLFQFETFHDQTPFPMKKIDGLADLLNFSHQMAVEEMFNLLDRFDPSWSKAIRVQTGIPINLHVINLGGGFSETGKKIIRKEEILSSPMGAMFKGMYFPGITWSGPIGVNLKGLMVIMAQSTSRPEEDFWDKTYALLSGEYMNYNSRLGYHYTSVDAYVCDKPMNNHIRFMFKGGAADDVRRARRARFIGAVLEEMGFEVVVQKDLVDSRFLGRDRTSTETNLDLIGRLMGCSRQRDMVMNDESIVSWHIEAFLRKNYTFDPAQ